MSSFVLDTNIITAIIKENLQVLSMFEEKLSEKAHRFLGCPIVYFEVQRGLLARDAKQQLTRLYKLFNRFQWQDYTREDWDTAAQLWAKRRALGLPIADADLLIGSFALNRGGILVTNKEADFAQLGLTLENWVKT